MEIETERLLIREFRASDAQDLHAIFGDAETMKNCEPAYSFEKTVSFLETFCIGKKGALAAVHKEGGHVIGYLLFHEFETGVYEIGWIFNRNCWRKGYAYEACKAVVWYAFEQLDAHKLFAEAIDGVKSVGLMKKLGMKPEGIQRSQTTDSFGNWVDLYLFGMLKEDWSCDAAREGEYGAG